MSPIDLFIRRPILTWMLILSLVVFFIVGALLLLRLDEKEGMRVAQEEDAAFAAQ